MSYPLIGVTTSRSTSRTGLSQITLTEAYAQALVRAGACPVLIPLGLPTALLQASLARLDGILFTGGGDIHPERYAGSEHPLVSDVDTDRDQVELSLLEEVVGRYMPFLGICRGLQLVNVGLGGSLYEDIVDQHPHGQRHQFSGEQPRNYLAHSVEILPESTMAGILGARRVQVNSLHHQGIRRLAPSLLATAKAPDGIIEAVELEDYPFGLAVQWHPEWLQEHPPMVELFRAFARAAASQP
jgi:putative glutamine amidotransferase